MHGNSEDAPRAQNRNYKRNTPTPGRYWGNYPPNVNWTSQHSIIANLYGNDWISYGNEYNSDSSEFIYRTAIIITSATFLGWGLGELFYRLFYGGG